MSNQLKQVGSLVGPCWSGHCFVCYDSLYIYFFSPSISGLSASFPLVGFPNDGVIRKGSGGETEGDTVAPSSSLEDAGGSRVSVVSFFLDRSSWWPSSYGAVNPCRQEVTSQSLV